MSISSRKSNFPASTQHSVPHSTASNASSSPHLDDHAIIAPALPDRDGTRKPHFWGELRLISKESFSGYDRTLTALNAGLTRAWNQDNPISWALARVRCEILQLTPHEYAETHGHLSHSTLAGLESSRNYERASYNPETIHLLFKGWDAIAKDRDDLRVTELVAEAKKHILDILTEKHSVSIYGALSRWRYEVGTQAFEKATGMNYKTLWGRHKNQMVPEFSELLAYGKKLGFIQRSEKPPSLWSNPKAIEIRDAYLHDCVARGRPLEVAKLHTVIHASGLKVDLPHLGPQSQSALQSITVRALARFSMVPWRKVSGAFSRLREQGLLTQDEWAAAKDGWQREFKARPKSAEDELVLIAKIEGLPTAHLVDALALRERCPQKPALPVFRTLRYGESSAIAPIGVLAHLIVRDDTLLQRLLNQKRSEIAAEWRRAGSSIQSSVAVERELWSVTYSDLPFTKADIQKLEWGKASAISEAEAISQIRRIGEERAQEALGRLSRQRDHSTVRSTFKNLIYQHGIAPLETKLGTSHRALENFRDGEEVPSLPRLRSFLERAAVPFTPALELDWREQMGRHLALLHSGDLERVLTAHVVEQADSRSELLRTQGSHISDVARYLHWLSENGTIDSKQLKAIESAFGIDPRGESGVFIAAVFECGSIPAAITRLIQQSPEPDKIRTTLEGVVSTGSSAADEDSSLTGLRSRLRGEGRNSDELIDILNLRRQLPGVTTGDIRQALNQQRPDDVALHEQFLKTCARHKISNRDIVYASRENGSSSRKPLSLIEKSLKQHLPSPTIPVGIAAILASTTMDEVEANIERAAHAVRLRLATLGVPANDLAVQMRLWGVRADDVQGGIKDLQQALWSDNEESIGRIMPQVLAIKQEKISNTLSRLLFRRSAVTPAQVLTCARESVPGGDRALVSKAGLVFGAPIRMAEGELVPTFKQLSDAVSLSGMKINGAITAEWLWAYSHRGAEDRSSPISRALRVHFALQEPQLMTEEDGGLAANGARSVKSTEHRLVQLFLDRADLSPMVYLRALRKAASSGNLAREHCEAISAGLGFEHKSPEGSFLQHCNSASSMQDAILAWCKQHTRNEAICSGLDALVSYIRNTETQDTPHKEELSQPQSVDHLVREWTSRKERTSDLPAGALRVAQCLAGATRSEIVMAAEAFKRHTLDERQRSQEQQESRRSHKQANRSTDSDSMSIRAGWVITPQMTQAHFETRLSLLAGRLMDGYVVANTDLRRLFPDYPATISAFTATMGQDTPWYVASLMCYKYPDNAMRRMLQEVQNNSVPRNRGHEHFEAHRRWLQERGSLGKLNETSIGLFFRPRYEHPLGGAGTS